jgi:hypothetical protein
LIDSFAELLVFLVLIMELLLDLFELSYLSLKLNMLFLDLEFMSEIPNSISQLRILSLHAS